MGGKGVALAVLHVVFVILRVLLGGVLGGLVSFNTTSLLVLNIFKGEETDPDDPLFYRVAPFPIASFVVYCGLTLADSGRWLSALSWGMLLGTVFAGGIAISVTCRIITRRKLFEEYGPLVQLGVGTLIFFALVALSASWWINIALLIAFYAGTEVMLGNFDLGDTINRIPSKRRRLGTQFRLAVFSDYLPILG